MKYPADFINKVLEGDALEKLREYKQWIFKQRHWFIFSIITNLKA